MRYRLLRTCLDYISCHFIHFLSFIHDVIVVFVCSSFDLSEHDELSVCYKFVSFICLFESGVHFSSDCDYEYGPLYCILLVRKSMIALFMKKRRTHLAVTQISHIIIIDVAFKWHVRTNQKAIITHKFHK